MQINIQKFNEVAEAAKAGTNDKRWRNAIDKAVAGVVSGWWIITELADGVMVTTESGATYHVTDHCSCRAAELGQPCKHLALRRLLELYGESDKVATNAAPARAPRITRSVERNYHGPAIVVYRAGGYMTI